MRTVLNHPRRSQAVTLVTPTDPITANYEGVIKDATGPVTRLTSATPLCMAGTLSPLTSAERGAQHRAGLSYLHDVTVARNAAIKLRFGAAVLRVE